MDSGGWGSSVNGLHGLIAIKQNIYSFMLHDLSTPKICDILPYQQPAIVLILLHVSLCDPHGNP